jgi:uncharacterized membrane protein YfcA
VDVTIGAVVVAAIATIAGATIQGAIGFGMNLVTVPVLALALPEALPVAVIVLGFGIAISMLRHEHHALDRAGIGWILVGRIPGTVCGALIVATVSISVLQGVVAVVVLVLVAASLLVPPLPVTRGTQLTAGAVSGVTGTAAGIGGPPLALLYQHHPGPTIRSTLAAAFLFGTVLSFVTLALVGEAGVDQLLLGVGLTPLALLGSVAGRRFHDQLDRGWLRPSVLIFAAIAAATVLVDALT